MSGGMIKGQWKNNGSLRTTLIILFVCILGLIALTNTANAIAPFDATYTGTGPYYGSIGGKTGILVTPANNSMLSIPAQLAINTSTWTIEFKMYYNISLLNDGVYILGHSSDGWGGSNANAIRINCYGNTVFLTVGDADGNSGEPHSTDIMGTVSTTGWHTFAARRNNTLLSFSIDGIEQGSVATPPNPAIQTKMYLGTDGDGDSHATGYYREVRITEAWRTNSDLSAFSAGTQSFDSASSCYATLASNLTAWKAQTSINWMNRTWEVTDYEGTLLTSDSVYVDASGKLHMRTFWDNTTSKMVNLHLINYTTTYGKYSWFMDTNWSTQEAINPNVCFSPYLYDNSLVAGGEVDMPEMSSWGDATDSNFDWTTHQNGPIARHLKVYGSNNTYTFYWMPDYLKFEVVGPNQPYKNMIVTDPLEVPESTGTMELLMTIGDSYTEGVPNGNTSYSAEVILTNFTYSSNDVPYPEPAIISNYTHASDSGSTIVDVSGNGHNGINTGGSLFTRPNGVRAIYYNGSESSYEYTNVPMSNHSGSISFWADLGATIDSWKDLLSLKVQNGANTDYLRIEQTYSDNAYKFYIFGPLLDVPETDTISVSTLNGSYHNYVLTWDTVEINLYIDGVWAYNGDRRGQWDYGGYNFTGDVWLGAKLNESNNFPMSITGEKIFSTKLSDDQIAELAENPPGGNTAPIANFTGTPTSGINPLTVTFSPNCIVGSGISYYMWDWGDTTGYAVLNGTEPFVMNHTYTTAGTYTVFLTVGNTYGEDTKTYTNYITVIAATTPTANFTSNKTNGLTPLCVQFWDNSTGYPASWQWQWGDGTANGTTQNPIHTYSNAGTYTVNLTASNANGSTTMQRTAYILAVAPTIPTSSFTSNKSEGIAPISVQFTDTSTGSPSSWQWQWGDGTANGTTQNPIHTYSNPGTYKVNLTASNANDTGTTYQSTITAYNQPPIASFTSTPTSGVKPLIITFDSSGSTGTITGYEWSWGDGTANGTTASPLHEYSDAGIYTVILTVSNDGGSSSMQRTGYITASNPTPTPTPTPTPVPAPVIVDFTAVPTSGNAPLEVAFSFITTESCTYQWSFGDNSANATTANASHTYSTTGTYTVILTVTNEAGSDAMQKTNYITVQAAPSPTPPMQNEKTSLVNATSALIYGVLILILLVAFGAGLGGLYLAISGGSEGRGGEQYSMMLPMLAFGVMFACIMIGIAIYALSEIFGYI